MRKNLPSSIEGQYPYIDQFKCYKNTIFGNSKIHWNSQENVEIQNGRFTGYVLSQGVDYKQTTLSIGSCCVIQVIQSIQATPYSSKYTLSSLLERKPLFAQEPGKVLTLSPYHIEVLV